ncbi:hypothetical protein BDZ94DRAFT_29700 [Collybia nuda]|uniref:Uncharacterized protein n=1 Tax=Collybia nuda TaxID=64659 RepID=A0A9P5YH45_9AGAR|nr:hypothetical protein BDZ94DRAFT_29700 [Collybia nuda]
MSYSWTGRPLSSEPDTEPTKGRKLAMTISALRHAQGIANMTPFPPLKGAVGLCLTVAQSVEAMKRNEQALVSLAETAGRLIVGITDATHSGNIPEDIQRMIEDLINLKMYKDL